jgi:hypothetical protein
MPRSVLLGSVPLLVGAAVLLAKVVASLLRKVRAARLAAVPLAPEGRVHLDAQGPLELAMEAARFSRDFAGVTFTLHRAADGQEVPLHRLLMRTQVSGQDKVRLSLYALELPGPGDYLLRASNVGTPAPGSAVVFARPLGLAIFTHVISLIVLGALLIGALVLSALTLGG